MAEQPKQNAFASPLPLPETSAIARVLSEAPYLARCSADKTAARIRPREYAVRYPYMQINRPGMVSWLIFDLDHANSLVWDDESLPPPNLIVRNRVNGHSHLFYAVHPICTTEQARSAPIQYMKAIYAAYAARLQADTEYASGPVAKTPGHPWWITAELHSHVYHLAELAGDVELSSERSWSKGPRLDQVDHSRHCQLFENLRYHAYRIVQNERDHGTFESFVRRLELYARNQNAFITQGFAENLPLSSLKSTVKSVARWTWDRYQGGGGCQRGVMGLSPDLPLAERQRLAAQRTHAQRAQQTEAKVRRACRMLQAAGAKLTCTAVAETAGLSRQTVAHYKHLLNEPPVAEPGRGQVAPIKPVKHAVHQVTGAPAQSGQVANGVGRRGGLGACCDAVNNIDRMRAVPFVSSCRSRVVWLASGNKWRILKGPGGDP